MKKMLALGVLALTLTLASNQQASAWQNVKFGIGLNFQWSGGGNNWLWGLWRSGDVPSPYGGGYGGGYGGDFGVPGYPSSESFFFGAAPMGSPMMGAPVYASPAPTPATTPPAAASTPASYVPATTYAYPQVYMPYQNVNYGYYSMPFYYYPATYYGR
jgi:hypothetical protein